MIKPKTDISIARDLLQCTTGSSNLRRLYFSQYWVRSTKENFNIHLVTLMQVFGGQNLEIYFKIEGTLSFVIQPYLIKHGCIYNNAKIIFL